MHAEAVSQAIHLRDGCDDAACGAVGDGFCESVEVAIEVVDAVLIV